ncbi:zinc finger protein 235-like [Culicoides brevitarsis]|uniref:zinc finger protein 235-like n=1 Tax=Culicoides brevitarsis TaxID=469753 RepID=UPI00307C233E
MHFNNKTCRFCLSEQKGDFKQKLDEIPTENPSDTTVKAMKNIFGWKVTKSDPLTKICMECKAKLLDVYIYVKKMKQNDQKWRREWIKSTSNDVIDLLSSDDETPQVKEEPPSDVESSDESDTDKKSPKIPLKRVKEEGETSESDDNEDKFRENELVIECDANATLVTSTTQYENEENVTETPPKRLKTLRARAPTTSIREWSTSEESSDSEIEEIIVPRTAIDLTQDPIPSTSKGISRISSTTATTSACSEIVAMGFTSLAEKMLAIKQNPSLTDDEMCKIFYGIECHLCSGLEFESLADLEVHLTEQHGIVKISVKCCDIEIIKPIMVDHIKFHLGMMKSSLKDHIRDLKKKKICEECGHLSSTEYQLAHHISRFHTEFHNAINTRSLNRDLSQVYDISSGQIVTSRYQCDECEANFYFESILRRHKMRNHMTLEEQLQFKKFGCHDCGEKFFDKHDVQRHIEVIHAKFRRMADARVKCLECDKILSSIYHLRLHKVQHWTAEERQRNKPPSTLLCQKCFKAFSCKKDMKKHLHTHMTRQELYESKKFECTVCKKRFWTEKNLTDHIKFYHLKQFDHVCGVCKRAYVSETNLRYHVCGQKPRKEKQKEEHECQFCGKISNSLDNLKSHLHQYHLPGYRFNCQKCGNGYNYSTSFYTHVKNCSGSKN